MPNPSQPVVHLRDVDYFHPARTWPTLRDVNLKVMPGEVVAVVGASGAGKTTLLRILTGEARPQRGTVHVAGLNLGELSPREMPGLRRRIGQTFADARLLPQRSAVGNVTYALELAGWSRSEARRRARAALDAVGVAHLSPALPGHMSTGEAQRVGIARALAGGPQLILADEPTGSLDPENSARVMETLCRVADESGTAIVLVTHDVAAVDSVGRRVVRIDDGCITEDRSDGTYYRGEVTA